MSPPKRPRIWFIGSSATRKSLQAMTSSYDSRRLSWRRRKEIGLLNNNGNNRIRRSEKRVSAEGRTGMLRSLDKRLRKLESRLLPERDKDEEFGVYFALFLLDAFGYYLGDPKPGEAPQTATARALGYEHEGEFNEAIK